MRAKILLGSLACLALTACQSVLGFDTTPHEVMAPSRALSGVRTSEGRSHHDEAQPGRNCDARCRGIPITRPSAASDQGEAARRYLDETGRSNCPIVFAREIAGPQFEFRFNCLAP